MNIFIKRVIVLFIAFFIVCTIKGSVNDWEAEHGRSSCVLINPPNDSIEWKFYGNQTVYVYLENGNVLGVIVRFGLEFGGTCSYADYELLPFQRTQEEAYSIFGLTPIPWHFRMNVVGSSALVYGYARWAYPIES